jgi:hypothetical protein
MAIAIRIYTPVTPYDLRFPLLMVQMTKALVERSGAVADFDTGLAGLKHGPRWPVSAIAQPVAQFSETLRHAAVGCLQRH